MVVDNTTRNALVGLGVGSAAYDAALAAYLPGGASVETWDLCLDNDFLYANLSYFGYQEGQKILDLLW